MPGAVRGPRRVLRGRRSGSTRGNRFQAGPTCSPAALPRLTHLSSHSKVEEWRASWEKVTEERWNHSHASSRFFRPPDHSHKPFSTMMRKTSRSPPCSGSTRGLLLASTSFPRPVPSKCAASSLFFAFVAVVTAIKTGPTATASPSPFSPHRRWDHLPARSTPPVTLERQAATCAQSSDCTNTVPANSNRYCKSGSCTFRTFPSASYCELD